MWARTIIKHRHMDIVSIEKKCTKTLNVDNIIHNFANTE